jgi:hypothetical protein
MEKRFIVQNIAPFDLMRWNKDEFYNFLDGECEKRFGVEVEVLEADLQFVKNGISVKIITKRLRG